jgi:hypothetical protein
MADSKRSAQPRIYIDANSGREAYLVSPTSASLAVDFDFVAGRPFVCLLAIDAREVHKFDIALLCAQLLNAGCAYFCAWGPDCERVHDLMDEEVLGSNPPSTDQGGVMTTWHADETLEDALDFLFHSANPDAEIAPSGCSVALIVTINSLALALQVEDYFRKGVTGLK